MSAEIEKGIPIVKIIQEELHALTTKCNEEGLISVDRPLTKDRFESQLVSLINKLQADVDTTQSATVLETATRAAFYNNLASNVELTNDSLSIWGLLDVILVLSETRQTGRALLWYLIEELIESQTASGCRIIFDYLDERRDRLTQREFQVTHLIILRTCNELLRRLSRAEDASFCGRVFFFLFQAFPLGEQSSVNLRGEFHTDNVINFEEKQEEGGEPTASPNTDVKGVIGKEKNDVVNADTNKFYTTFWQLQQYFSMPTRLFDNEQRYADFKTALEQTIEVFSKTPVIKTGSSNNDKKGVKRKRSYPNSDQDIDNYNPRYLTSRELFHLELSDTTFHRHVLVQALILLEFLLSLAPEVQKKLDDAHIERLNLAVNYAFVLHEEKRKWIISIQAKIATYLTQGPEGQFYYRMVSTVLARDKNWIWWKLKRCPSIVKEPLGIDDYLGAIKGCTDATANRRMRARPVGSMDLTFLSEADKSQGLESLKDLSRCAIPTIDNLLHESSTCELDLDFAEGEEKEILRARIDSLTWRAVRATARTSLSRLDKLEPDKKLKDIIDQETQAHEERNGTVGPDSRKVIEAV